jgi:hypothetical protein
MTSKQYEQLCRFFLSDQLGIPAKDILSVDLSSPRRPGLPEYKHQIDLYWETDDAVARYVNIANAKWRSSDKVEQGEVMLLQKVAAHKAVMITNSGFTRGAVAAAKDEGIALHVVRPTFDFATLHANDAVTIHEQIQRIATNASGPLYSNEVVHRALDPRPTPAASGPQPVEQAHSNRMLTNVSNRALTPSTDRTASPAGQGGVGTTRTIDPAGRPPGQGGGPEIRTK